MPVQSDAGPAAAADDAPLAALLRSFVSCCGRAMGNCLPRRVETDGDEQYLAVSEQRDTTGTGGSRRGGAQQQQSPAAGVRRRRPSRESQWRSTAADSRGPPPPYMQQQQQRVTHGRQRSRDDTAAVGAEQQAAAAQSRRAQLIAQLPVDEYTVDPSKGPGGATSECIICMGDFAAGDKLRYLPCMHSFHLACIDQWLGKKLRCPSCMEPVDGAMLSSLYAGQGALACGQGDFGDGERPAGDLFRGVSASYGRTGRAKAASPTPPSAAYVNQASTSHQQ